VQVSVSLENKQAMVLIDSSRTSPGTVASGITNMGFDARVSSAANGQGERTRVIRVEGMTCQSCVRNIQNNMASTPGLSSIVVSLPDKQATVRFNPALVTAEQIRKGIDDMGFDAYLSDEDEFAKIATRGGERATSSSRQCTISIQGMTCNSCVRNIEANIGDKPGVKAIKVSLADNNGVVTFDPSVVKATSIAKMIDDMGFDARLVSEDGGEQSGDRLSQIAVRASPRPGPAYPGGNKTCLISIFGMTCNSCVRNIESNIKDRPGIVHIRVSLPDNNGTVTYNPSVTDPARIAEMIDDMGFDASVAQQDFSCGDDKDLSAHPRTSIISVLGMTCNSCVRKIESHLTPIAGVYNVTVSLADQNCEVVYTPAAISLTQIVQLINDLGFKASVARDNVSNNSGGSVKRVVMGIKGMTCQSCVRTIKGKLSEHPAVKSISVSLEAETGTIDYDSNKATPQMLAEVIEDMGFDAVLPGNLMP
jgi:Cu+-exporting ATPase